MLVARKVEQIMMRATSKTTKSNSNEITIEAIHKLALSGLHKIILNKNKDQELPNKRHSPAHQHSQGKEFNKEEEREEEVSHAPKN